MPSVDADLIRAYNYDEFVDDKFEHWMQFDHSPALGERAPDFEVTDLAGGGSTRLSHVWGAHRYTIVEFGSLT
jgi:hypothetical protein